MFFMFFTMVVVFPLSAIITHAKSSLRQIIIQPRILLDEFEGEGKVRFLIQYIMMPL